VTNNSTDIKSLLHLQHALHGTIFINEEHERVFASGDNFSVEVGDFHEFFSARTKLIHSSEVQGKVKGNGAVAAVGSRNGLRVGTALRIGLTVQRVGIQGGLGEGAARVGKDGNGYSVRSTTTIRIYAINHVIGRLAWRKGLPVDHVVVPLVVASTGTTQGNLITTAKALVCTGRDIWYWIHCYGYLCGIGTTVSRSRYGIRLGGNWNKRNTIADAITPCIAASSRT